MGKVKLTPEQIRIIKTLVQLKHYTHQEIADMFCVSRGHITKIKNKKRWNYEYGEKSNTKEEEGGRYIQRGDYY